MNETRTYSGLLSSHSHGEADDILFLSSLSDPLAEELEWIKGKPVTVRYWITDRQVSRNEAHEQFLKTVLGVGDAKFCSHYSDYTGYLWTDEELKIGGHDLMAELRSHVGKWLILEIVNLDPPKRQSPDERAFRKSLAKDPSLGPAFADWLDEQGRVEEANYYRRARHATTNQRGG